MSSNTITAITNPVTVEEDPTELYPLKFRPERHDLRTEGDIADLRRLTRPVVGRPVLGAELIYPDELTIEIGDPVRYAMKTTGPEYDGEWSLLTRDTPWSLSGPGGFVVKSDDDHETINERLGVLRGREIAGIDVRFPSLDLALEFSDGYRLEIRSSRRPNSELNYWLLFMPQGEVVLAGPGAAWFQGPSD